MAWTVIIKNNSGSTVELEDFGIELLNGTQKDFTNYFAYDEISGSKELKDKVLSSDLVVNDGTNDLTAANGAEYITLENVHNVSEEHYTKTELQSDGTSQIHWNNITNAPSFGAPIWVDPIKYRIVKIDSTAPATPNTGDVYVNTGDNHYYKWDGSAWQDEGSAATDDRIINLDNATQNIYTFDGSSWSDGGQSSDNEAAMINDDGDGKNSQYVYQTEDDTWRKISDVDFASHFDGGSSKHDASEIDVEGSYSNFSHSPGDLETVISDINTQMTEALDNNTLDGAYDEGGAGAGRTITVDSGPVVLDTASATTAPLELPPKAALPTTGLQDGQLAIRDSILCIYDSTRSKWLSVQRQFLVFGRRRKVSNQYLNFCVGNLASKNSGFRIVRDACIVSISGQLDDNGSCSMNIRRNDTSTNIVSLSISSAIGNSDVSSNINLNADDYLQCYLSSASDVEDPVCIIEIAWRL
jgi:hypothetical protein